MVSQPIVSDHLPFFSYTSIYLSNVGIHNIDEKNNRLGLADSGQDEVCWCGFWLDLVQL